MSLSLPSTSLAPSVPLWRRTALWFSPVAFRTKPQWLPATVLTAVLIAVMPLVHLQIYGAEAIADAAVEFARHQLGAPLGGDAAALVRQSVLDRSLAGSAVAAVIVTSVTVLLAGMALNVGALLAGAELSAAQALGVTALAALGATLLRVFTFAVVAMALPHDASVSSDWLHTANTSLGVWIQSDQPAVRTLLGALDVGRVAQVVLSVLALRAVQPRIGVLGATAAAVLWTAVVVATLVGVSAVFSIPII